MSAEFQTADLSKESQKPHCLSQISGLFWYLRFMSQRL